MPHNLPEERASLDISSVSDSGAGVAPGKSDASLHSRSDTSTNRRDACPAIPDHELLKKIGDGSYGEVWLARSAVGTLRAVKIVWRKTFGHEHPFEREFKGIQKFEPISRSHEGMVDILQIGRGDGYFYYVMELADDARRNPDDEIRNPKEAPNDKPSPAAQPLLTSGIGIPSTFVIRIFIPLARCATT